MKNHWDLPSHVLRGMIDDMKLPAFPPRNHFHPERFGCGAMSSGVFLRRTTIIWGQIITVATPSGSDRTEGDKRELRGNAQ